MVSRGEVGLIIAKIGLDSGYLAEDVFSAIVGMILLTTLVTPPLLRFAFALPEKKVPVTGSPESNQKKEN